MITYIIIRVRSNIMVDPSSQDLKFHFLRSLYLKQTGKLSRLKSPEIHPKAAQSHPNVIEKSTVSCLLSN